MDQREFEQLCMTRELCYSVHHLLQGRGVGVIPGSHLGSQNNALQQFTQLVAGVHHFVAYVLSRHLPRKHVPNEHKFVSIQNDKFAVSHEDSRGLGSIDATEEGVDGI